ncbi:hypothetical protein B566_EDAN010697 [Ephemera danica]|nr:hypothetical protein B566_EDAN010697 [Ephemera danica]
MISLYNNTMNVLRNLVSKPPHLRSWRFLSSVKRNSSSYEGDGKTTVTILNNEVDVGLMIDSYSQMGFRLNNGMVILGPLALFPRSALAWNISGPNDVNMDSLELFFRLEPKLDLLVLGLGNMRTLPTPTLLVECRKRGLNLEVLPTEQACATFNFLTAEARCVAAALIPPEFLSSTDDDVVRSNIRHGRITGGARGNIWDT